MKDRNPSLPRDQENTKLWKPDKSDCCLKCKPAPECSPEHTELKTKFNQKAITIKASIPLPYHVKRKNECLLLKLTETALRKNKNKKHHHQQQQQYIYIKSHIYICVCRYNKTMLSL